MHQPASVTDGGVAQPPISSPALSAERRLSPTIPSRRPDDPPAYTPAYTPAEAAQRLPRDAWQQTTGYDSHGKALVRYIAELELGTAYGPTRGVRLVAATRDPAQLKPESTWYLATSLPLEQINAAQVYKIYRLRDWIEHFYKPVKHELGWTDYQVRSEQAIVRHWQLVLLAYTFSLLVGAAPPSATPVPSTTPSPLGRAMGGEKIGASRPTERPHTRRADRLGGDVAPGTGLALPLGAAAPLLATLVERRPTARTGRAPRPRRALPPT
jgi:hypothetical protein